MDKRKKIALIAAPIVLIIVLGYIFAPVLSREIGFSSKPGVKYNDLSVSESNIDADLKALTKNKALVKSLESSGTPLVDDNGKISDVYSSSWANIQLQILSIRELREDKGMKVTDEDRKDAEEAAKSLFVGQNTEDAKKIWDSFPKSFQKRLIEGYAEQNALLRAAKDPSKKEIQKYFDENKDTFTKCDSGKTVSHILVSSEKKANEIKKELENGGDFAELAKKNSTDPGSASKRGDLGCYVEGQFVPEFDAVAKTLAFGKVSDVTKTDFGYHIIKTEEFKAPTVNDVKDQIIQQLLPEKQKPLFEEVQKRMKKAKITVLEKYGKVQRDSEGNPSIVPLKSETSTTTAP